MDRFGPLLGIVVVVALVVAGVWAFTHSSDEHGDNNADFPDGIHYLCAEADCGHEFTITVKQRAEYNKAHYGESYPCPKCNRNEKNPIRAGRCKNCQRYFKVGRGAAVTTCPHCKQPVTP
ncbi:MAG: hypothetical protein ISS78_10675 [Phycisphaerae bacterium]|nr:hypothetical protein [Phycisphaerae bacterium]